MLTLIYARYSSTLQNPRSIADQLAACRARCAAEGWDIAGEYSDAAISGAAGTARHQRPGLAALLARLEQGDVRQVLTESTDRLARHQGDDFAVREAIAHAGARLFTLMQGEVDDITGTINGLFAARTRKDLAARVRRGHKGNIAQGRAASGVAFGYRRVTDTLDAKGDQVRGLRAIDETTADIVRALFTGYRDGRSFRQLAADLNAAATPAPRGGKWQASTVQKILTNPVYIGRLEYGRTEAVTDPRTRQRRMRPGTGEVASGEAPHLRIVSDDLWQAVQDQMAQRSAAVFAPTSSSPRKRGPSATSNPCRQRRPRHLLSGLGQCGVCGGGWVVTRGDYLGCGNVLYGNACTNRRLIRRAEYEERVLAELRGQMLAPEVVEAYLDEYRLEHARQARDAAGRRGALERRRADAERKVARLVAAIAEGGGEFAEIRTALAHAKRDQAEAEKALASTDALPRIALHPGLARQYRAAIENLAEELADDATRREAAPRLRKLIARVIATPAEGKRGVHLEVVRHIDELLALATAPEKRRA